MDTYLITATVAERHADIRRQVGASRGMRNAALARNAGTPALAGLPGRVWERARRAFHAAPAPRPAAIA